MAFGSRISEHTREFEPSLLTRCAPDFRRDLVAFDWWVRNADRTLGAISGNPNLLWNSEIEAPVVIDHNMAFDRDFDAPLFRQTHVFRADFDVIAGDMLLRRLRAALQRVARGLCCALGATASELGGRRR